MTGQFSILMKRNIFFITFLITGNLLAQDLRVAGIFGDNMVIQQGINAPVWGTAAPGETLEIHFAGLTTSVVVDSTGRWMGRMPSLQAGGPFDMTISGTRDTVVFKNVLIGEVWLASGQSNMTLSVNHAANSDQEIAHADYPEIRMMTVPFMASPTPLDNLEGGRWERCTPESVRAFSAVGYYFGRELYKETHVPVGIVHASRGATPAEAWTSTGVLRAIDGLRDKVDDLPEQDEWNDIVQHYHRLDAIRDSIAKNSARGLALKVHEPGFDDSGWKSVGYPVNTARMKIPKHWGFIWFRKAIELAGPRDDYRLVFPHLAGGQIDIYFNGVLIAQNENKSGKAEYIIPRKAVRKGRNVLVMNNYSHWAIHAIGNADSGPAYLLSSRNKKIPLDGEWLFNEALEAHVTSEWTCWFCTPGVLFNGMIAPIIPYGIRGAIWYQGESNVLHADQYKTLFPLLIMDWRTRFRQGNFPFLFVQLAGYGKKTGSPGTRYWPALREAQMAALHLPDVGMAVAIDIGEADDIHPKNKQEVGKRLMLAAAKIAYGQDIVYSGPVYESMQITGPQVRLTFSNIGGGLSSKNAELWRGFEVAGADQKFHPATEAHIEGDEVIVRSDRVPQPVAVRYAWHGNPDATLYNDASLPAPPFRTDNWDLK